MPNSTAQDRGEEKVKHHDRGQQDADGHERPKLRQAGKPAEVQQCKRWRRGQRRPKNARAEDALDFSGRKLRLGDPFLVKHQSVVHGQAKQDRGEAQAHGVELSEDQSARGECAGDDERQHGEQPQQRTPTAMRPPEQSGNQNQSAQHRAFNVALHPRDDFGDERRRTGKAHRDLARPVR